MAPEVCQCNPGYKGIECEVSISSATQQTNSSSSFPAGAIAGIVIGLALLIAAFVVALLILYRYQKKHRRFRPKVIEPQYQTLIFGPLCQKYLFQGIGNTNYQSFEQVSLRMFFFIKRNILVLQLLLDKEFLTHFLDMVPVSDLDEFAKFMTFFYESKRQTSSLFQIFINDEIEKTDSASNLFSKKKKTKNHSKKEALTFSSIQTGGNSFSTKLFKVYSKLHGLKYLFRTFAEFIAIVGHKVQEEGQSEVDPSRIDSQIDLQSNKV